MLTGLKTRDMAQLMAGPRDIDETDDEEVLDPNEGADAGQIDDDGGDEAEARQEPEADQAEERVDRRQRREDRTAEELRALREHNARVEAELAQIRAERQQRQQPQEESDEHFRARIAALDPMDQMRAELDRVTRRHDRQLALATFASADRADKAAYDSMAATNPLYKKHAQAVEGLMVEARRRGIDIDRSTALNIAIGQSVRENQGKPSAARQQAQQRVQRQQATTSGGRGDQAREQPRQRRYAPGDMSAEAVRHRLEADDAYI